MKTSSMVLSLLLGLFVHVEAKAATWGVEELLAAQEASTEALKVKAGASALTGVKSLSIALNAQKIAANAKITYTVEGKTKTVSFFCHEHEPKEIDCH